MGYGPGSLSSPYAVNVTFSGVCVPATVTYGIPYSPPPPKSACRNRLPPLAAIDAR